MMLRVILFFLLSSFAFAQTPEELCANGIQDTGEDGADCGLAACGTQCYNVIGTTLPAPGEAFTQPTEEVPSFPPQTIPQETPSKKSSEQPSTSLPSEQIQEQLPPAAEQITQQDSQVPTLPETAQQAPLSSSTSDEMPGETSLPLGKATAYGIGDVFIVVGKYIVSVILLLGLVAGAYYGYTVATTKNEVAFNPELLNYIKMCQAKAIKKEQMLYKLQEAGYTKEEIDFHMKQV